jgi:hypothetical protein
MKVRIKKSPREREMDGISLDMLKPGAVREVSARLATWLIVAGYADPEMRQAPEGRYVHDRRSRATNDRRRRGTAHQS